jgi:hypothetical protein
MMSRNKSSYPHERPTCSELEHWYDTERHTDRRHDVAPFRDRIQLGGVRGTGQSSEHRGQKCNRTTKQHAPVERELNLQRNKMIQFSIEIY